MPKQNVVKLSEPNIFSLSRRTHLERYTPQQKEREIDRKIRYFYNIVMYSCFVIWSEENPKIGGSTAFVTHSTAILRMLCTANFIRMPVVFSLIIDTKRCRCHTMPLCASLNLDLLNDTPNEHFNLFCFKDCTKPSPSSFRVISFSSLHLLFFSGSNVLDANVCRPRNTHSIIVAKYAKHAIDAKHAKPRKPY